MKKNPGLRAIYNNLRKLATAEIPVTTVLEESTEYGLNNEGLLRQASAIDKVVKKVRPDDWRGAKAKENIIKSELLKILQDRDKVEKIFLIIKQQQEY